MPGPVQEKDIIEDLLRTNPQKALQYLYEEYYDSLCKQVYLIVRDETVTEDIVQEVFIEVWKIHDQIRINTSMAGYLKRACRNRTLNYLRDKKFNWEDESVLISHEDTGFTSEQYLDADDLNRKVQESIATMPEKCGIIFSLSRYNDMNYTEIAEELKISVKTVEHQISKALRILRKEIFKKE